MTDKLPHAPPPWTCKCEAYWLFLTLDNPLPPNIYAPLTPSQGQAFSGGLGIIQIIRYTDTPVGPYDELLVIPGTFTMPGGTQNGKSRYRITRVYVSQTSTLYNGRRNWNIPKELARFEFSAPSVRKGESPPKELTVSVYPPGEGKHQPFFSATLTPSRWLPPIPLSSATLPLNTYLVQPPLPAGKDQGHCGTDDWKGFHITASTSHSRLMWVHCADIDDDDAKNYWPRDAKPWRLGAWLEDATLEIAAPQSFMVE